ncbi:MAG: hypothetical protein V2A61_08410 [Calditrichota bacterium]
MAAGGFIWLVVNSNGWQRRGAAANHINRSLRLAWIALLSKSHAGATRIVELSAPPVNTINITISISIYTK